jgi:LmbE family N-acetylglucosaminyl deacetylase
MTVRTLLGVYAHPDDESTCAGGVIAHHAANGVRVIVVTCTNGEFGGADPDVRSAELDAACRRLGVAGIHRLGYHDSGMPHQTRDGVFSRVPVEAVSARIGELLDMYQPEVVLTHNADATYEHVDHQHAAQATALAVADTPATLYFSAHGLGHWQRLLGALAELGIHRPAPDAGKREALAAIDRRITTRVEISHVVRTKRAALFEHKSQLGNSLAAKLTEEQYASVFAAESFIRVQGADDGWFTALNA